MWAQLHLYKSKLGGLVIDIHFICL